MAIFKKSEKSSSKSKEKKVVEKEDKKTAKHILQSSVIRPVVTEKTSAQQTNGVFTFVVKLNANKIQISQDLFQMYGVKPVEIRTQIVRGKEFRRGKIVGKRSSWKKAVVQFEKGTTIHVFEGV